MGERRVPAWGAGLRERDWALIRYGNNWHMWHRAHSPTPAGITNHSAGPGGNLKIFLPAVRSGSHEQCNGVGQWGEPIFHAWAWTHTWRVMRRKVRGGGWLKVQERGGLVDPGPPSAGVDDGLGLGKLLGPEPRTIRESVSLRWRDAWTNLCFGRLWKKPNCVWITSWCTDIWRLTVAHHLAVQGGQSRNPIVWNTWHRVGSGCGFRCRAREQNKELRFHRDLLGGLLGKTVWFSCCVSSSVFWFHQWENGVLDIEGKDWGTLSGQRLSGTVSGGMQPQGQSSPTENDPDGEKSRHHAQSRRKAWSTSSQGIRHLLLTCWSHVS